jgi:hypothetical protein
MKRFLLIMFALSVTFISKSQLTIISVSQDTVCEGAKITLTVHIGPDKSMFYDSLMSFGYSFAPDSIRMTPFMCSSGFCYTFSDSFNIYIDSTMINQDRTFKLITVNNIQDSFRLLVQQMTKYQSSGAVNFTWGNVPQYNSNSEAIYQNLYFPLVYVDSVRSFCANTQIALLAIASSGQGIYCWSNSFGGNDTGQVVIAPFGNFISGFANLFNCIYVDTTSKCRSLQGTTILYQKQHPNQDICVVTLDSSFTHNVIIWDKNQPLDTVTTAAIDSFFLFRGSQRILSQPFSSYSSYTDFSADIALQSWTYSVAAHDVCLSGTTTNAISTMFQEQPNNGDITWYPYTGGTVGTYSVMRDALGNGNWTLLDTISAYSTTITVHDTNAVTYPNTKYQIEANGGSCNPRNTYTLYSNVRSVQATGIETLNIPDITFYPNPVNDILHISEAQSHILITSMEGKKIMDKYDSGKSIDVSGIHAGIYLLSLNGSISKLIKY